MSFITGKHIPRRTFLRGVGATVALPFLDAMVPAGRVFAKSRATERTRLICIEEVHGLAGCNNWAATKYLFAPQQVGANFAPALGFVSGVVTAYGAAPREPWHGDLILYPLIGSLMAAVLNAGNNALNQIYDLEIDRVNKP